MLYTADMDKLVTIRIDSAVIERFKRLCDEKGWKIGRTIERLLRQELNDHGSKENRVARSKGTRTK